MDQPAGAAQQNGAADAAAPGSQPFVKVFLPKNGIQFGAARAAIWHTELQKFGVQLVEERPNAPLPEGITHCVVGAGGLQALPPALRPHSSQPTTSGTAGGSPPAANGTRKKKKKKKRNAAAPAQQVAQQAAQPAAVEVQYVTEDWISQSIKARQPLPADFPPAEPQPVSSAPPAAGAAAGASSLAACSLGGAKHPFQRWLGEEFWHGGCADMSSNELALQAVYSRERSRDIGNERLVQALNKLARYERGLHQEYYSDVSQFFRDGKKFNHLALQYSHAAAMARACAFKIGPDVETNMHSLPFVDAWIAKQIQEILHGFKDARPEYQCETLANFRDDLLVKDSHGVDRGDSVGAATRTLFASLPCVGVATAKLWWDLGCRSFEDVERMAQPGGELARDGKHALTIPQRFSLAHRADLLKPNTAAADEVEEMRAVVLAALEAVSGSDGQWRIEVVGGSRRSTAYHDADFLATQPTKPTEGVILQLAEKLVADGRLFPPALAMCQLQGGRMPNHIAKLKGEEPSTSPMDKFDHVFGIYRTKCSNKVRRIDIIICPPDEWPYALLGWTGSRQFLRFMRGFAKERDMCLTSHRLFSKIDGEWRTVPAEARPLDRNKQPRWPPGWHRQRRVESERDIFELVGLPYREPSQRDA